MANSVQILSCFIQGLHGGAVSNPTAAQRRAFSRTFIAQGVPMAMTNSISLEKAEFTLFAMRLWNTSILHPFNNGDKMKRILWLVIAFLNEGALSPLVPCVVAVSVVTTDCTEKEVSVNCWHVNSSYLWVWFTYIPFLTRFMIHFYKAIVNAYSTYYFNLEAVEQMSYVIYVICHTLPIRKCNFWFRIKPIWFFST